MATLNTLKKKLRQQATTTSSHPLQPLSEAQYKKGFDSLFQGSTYDTYEKFILPELSLVLTSLLDSRTEISMLEVGPGPRSVIGSLPNRVRQSITNYVALEPNLLFADCLRAWLSLNSESGCPLPSLRSRPKVHGAPFSSDANLNTWNARDMDGTSEAFDIVLFCHSMYGMQPNRMFVERATELLVARPEGGLVVIFHREGVLRLEGLVSHQSSHYPWGSVDVAVENNTLDCFNSFIAGLALPDHSVDTSTRDEWRKTCRALGRHDHTTNRLFFSSPEMMVTFTRHATALSELMELVPVADQNITIKNWESRRRYPASIMRPVNVQQIQQCVCWALKHGVSLTVVGGGHSGHCLHPHVVSVNMGAFRDVRVHRVVEREDGLVCPGSYCLVAEAGCKTGDIVRKAAEADLIVPLGARPSVGAGLWLQGGIGHLSRLHGLSCDAIMGAVIVSVASSEVFYVGDVPNQFRPAGAVSPHNEQEILWGLRGAGTNFGIVVSVTFKAYAGPVFSIRNWVLALNDHSEARQKLSEFSKAVAKPLPRNQSADAYLYWDVDKLHLGVTMFETSTTSTSFAQIPASLGAILGSDNHEKTADGSELFNSEMYISQMHGGHAGGKTSSFKRCVFLKNIGEAEVAERLLIAVQTRPTPLSYLHLLQGGGAIGGLPSGATAFGCRDWDFACVITGVWPRSQDETKIEIAAVQWVYSVVKSLLPVSSGVYGADLGPDPRDAGLAIVAFGRNRQRLLRLKHRMDPYNVLSYACPLKEIPSKLKFVIIVTGRSGVGKDYCAVGWASLINTASGSTCTARSVSISDVTKQEYAAATGADLTSLHSDRAYKEGHRSALEAFFQEQVRQRPQLPEEHFLAVVHDSTEVDVLFITGMRDMAPVATLSHLIQDIRLLEVRIECSHKTRDIRRGCRDPDDKNDDDEYDQNSSANLTFNNESFGNEDLESFFERHLHPLLHEDFQRLARMVSSTLDFPRQGIEFRHILNISQRPGGLSLCTNLLHKSFSGGWKDVAAVVCCEVGGFIFASALAAHVDLPLALIRQAGKLPPPIISVVKSPSHISSPSSSSVQENRIEMSRISVPKDASVVVVDDVLATGRTLLAMLSLLDKAGICAEDICVLVVAEFPLHRGRDFLLQHGFGRVKIQSLLAFGGL